MIDKVAAGDDLRQAEEAGRKTGARGNPERQPPRRAEGQIEGYRNRDRYEVVLDEAAQHDEERRAQQAEAIGRARDVTDQSAEHDRFAQTLRVISNDPGACDQIAKAHGTGGPKDRVGSRAAEAPDRHRRKHPDRYERNQRGPSSAPQQIMY